MERVSLRFPDGIFESQKDPFYFCASIFTAISCKNQRCGRSGREEVGHCHSSGLLAVAGWSERKGDFRGAERSFEMSALREEGHLLAEGKCR